MIKRWYPLNIRTMFDLGDPGGSRMQWQNNIARAALLAPTYVWDPGHYDFATSMNALAVAKTTITSPSYAVDNATATARLTCSSISFPSVSVDYRYCVIYCGNTDSSGRSLVLLDHEATISPAGAQVVIDIDPALGVAQFGLVA